MDFDSGRLAKDVKLNDVGCIGMTKIQAAGRRLKGKCLIEVKFREGNQATLMRGADPLWSPGCSSLKEGGMLETFDC